MNLTFEQIKKVLSHGVHVVLGDGQVFSYELVWIKAGPVGERALAFAGDIYDKGSLITVIEGEEVEDFLLEADFEIDCSSILRYEIGERVQVCTTPNGKSQYAKDNRRLLIGLIGVVRACEDDLRGLSYVVEFNRQVDGNRCWIIPHECLVPVSQDDLSNEISNAVEVLRSSFIDIFSKTQDLLEVLRGIEAKQLQNQSAKSSEKGKRTVKKKGKNHEWWTMGT